MNSAQVGSVPTKICHRCLIEKSTALDFNPSKTHQDGFSHYCKACLQIAPEPRGRPAKIYKRATGIAAATPNNPNPVATAPYAAAQAAIDAQRRADDEMRRQRAADAARLAITTEDDDFIEPADIVAPPVPELPPNPYGYIASKKLLMLWNSVLTGRTTNDKHALTMLFIGPSGSGKTEAAEYLAKSANLPFTKIDAPSMTDPEAWFGTREVVNENGTSVTKYRDSEFVRGVENPGVVFIDEFNRASDFVRNILLGLSDRTHAVTNPITGLPLVKHPDCIFIFAGNRGLNFTGTYPIDPAFLSRTLKVKFEYLGTDDEINVIRSLTLVDKSVAELFVRFANETRQRAVNDPDMTPISTRELVIASVLAANGTDPDTAMEATVIDGASDEGGAASVAFRLKGLWGALWKRTNPEDPDF